jgi:hypothetical protein
MENTLLFGFFVVCGLIAVFLTMKRILAADAAAYGQPEKGRLD